MRFGIRGLILWIWTITINPSSNTKSHPSVLRGIRPYNFKLQFSDIQTIELRLHLILIPCIIQYSTQFNSILSNIELQTHLIEGFVPDGEMSSRTVPSCGLFDRTPPIRQPISRMLPVTMILAVPVTAT
jgi:hypothetical protein